MAISVIQLVPPQQLTDSAVAYYTSINTRTRIDKLSVTNTDGSAHMVSVYLVPSGGSADSSNLITNARTLMPGETWNCPDVVGQVMAVGSQLVMAADAVSSLTVSAAGALLS